MKQLNSIEEDLDRARISRTDFVSCLLLLAMELT